MEAGSYDYTVEGGDPLDLHVILKTPQGSPAVDTPMNLTGHTSEVALTWCGGTLTLASNDGSPPSLVITDADGDIAGQLTGAQTAALPEGRLTQYKWSITSADGEKTTFLKGYIDRK
jgi:hypothetical protein